MIILHNQDIDEFKHLHNEIPNIFFLISIEPTQFLLSNLNRTIVCCDRETMIRKCIAYHRISSLSHMTIFNGHDDTTVIQEAIKQQHLRDNYIRIDCFTGAAYHPEKFRIARTVTLTAQESEICGPDGRPGGGTFTWC